MKNLIILLLTCILFNACGQNREIRFESKFLPNSEYVADMVTKSKATMNFSGPEEQINNIKASGIKLPMIIEGSNSVVSILRTMELENDSTFKATMKYDNYKSIQVQNGDSTEKESPIAGMLIEGFYNPQNEFKIDTIIGDKIDPVLRQTLTYTLENAQKHMTFPDYPLKVGDSFQQDLPMNIPIAGISNVAILIKTTYQLDDISENIASFTFDQTVELNMDANETTVSATGDGTGTSQFDISKQFVTKYESDLTMEIQMSVDSLTVNAEINGITSQNVTIK